MNYSKSQAEEFANSATHGVGAALAVLGLVFLIRKALGLDGRALAVYVIFAGAMALMFLASALYHGLQSPGVKRLFRVFDHQASYLFIAGTYTPFCLLGLKGAWGWSLFGFEWGLAALGITLYACGCSFVKKAELAIFILMGWAIVAGFVPAVKSLPLNSLILLFAGGAAYTTGAFFYVRGKKIPGAHVVWHLFVIAGAVLHYWSVWFIA
jgi:hemolysin III